MKKVTRKWSIAQSIDIYIHIMHDTRAKVAVIRTAIKKALFYKGSKMQIQLQQFALFQRLQTQLDAITAEQLVTVRAGKPLNADDKVIGVMPDPLKGLLYLRDKITDAANKIINTLPDGPMSDEVFIELALLKEAHEKANFLFFEAFRAEFPSIADKEGVGYGPNFEIYYSDTPSQKWPNIVDSLRGAGFAIFG